MRRERGELLMASDLKEFMEAEICVMLKEIGRCSDANSAHFTKKALEWIEKNAAGFRAQWDRKKRKIVARKRNSRQEATVYDLE
jgi:hypothetical protein